MARYELISISCGVTTVLATYRTAAALMEGYRQSQRDQKHTRCVIDGRILRINEADRRAYKDHKKEIPQI